METEDGSRLVPPDAPAPRRCSECGKENPASSRFCFCGHNLAFVDTRPAPVGVGGWLLFFCLQVALLGPLLTVMNVMADVRTLRSSGGLWTRGAALVAVDDLVRLALAGMGVGAGVLLWLRHHSAVVFTRAYLVCLAASGLVLLGFVYAFALPADTRDRIAPIYLFRAAIAIPGSIFWLQYFKHSKRVKATYVSPLAP
jgi:hypothetical protein